MTHSWAVMAAKTTNRLRRARQHRGISLTQASRDTHIPEKTLRAFEAGKTTGLHPGYDTGLLNTYHRYLGIKPPTRREVTQSGASRRRTKLQQPHATTELLRRGTTITLIVIALAYGLWQGLQLVSAPRLALDSPREDSIVTTSSLEVAGETSAGAEVYINNNPIPIDPSGHFRQTVTLRQGRNELEIVSINSLGKRATVRRTIILQPQE